MLSCFSLFRGEIQPIPFQISLVTGHSEGGRKNESTMANQRGLEATELKEKTCDVAKVNVFAKD